MTQWTRREWTKAVLGGLVAAVPAAAETARPRPARLADPHLGGVLVGVHSGNFAALSLDEAAQAMKALGVRACELAAGHVEPKELLGPRANREQLRRWRLTTALDDFAAQGAKLEAAGIAVLAYNVPLGGDCTDAEIERLVLIARALGAPCLTAALSPAELARCTHFAREHSVRIAVLNDGGTSQESLMTAAGVGSLLSGAPPQIGLGVDLGAFAAAGQDVRAFLRDHWRQTWMVRLSDCKRGQSAHVSWGQGEAAIAETLRLLREARWPIAAVIDSVASSRDAIAEVRRCLAACREALGVPPVPIDSPVGGA